MCLQSYMSIALWHKMLNRCIASTVRTEADLKYGVLCDHIIRQILKRQQNCIEINFVSM